MAVTDERLNDVKLEEDQTLNKNNTMYNSMIKDSNDFYQAQIDASKDYVDKQTQLQQEKTDFAIEKIEQQKEQANKDYLKEQSGAYVDWQKESNRYGANAEEMAAGGFVASGYGESSQVSMYNTYQNRVATAREVYNRAVLNYDNAIKDAQLQNNSLLAEIAYEGLQKQLELALQGFQYENQLIEQQANKQLEIKNMYHQQYMDVLQQINTENALAEQIRQHNESMALQREKFEEEKRQYNETLAEQKRQYNESLAEQKRQYNARLSSSGSGSDNNTVKYKDSNNDVEYIDSRKYEVNTAYYKGNKNKDCKYGTFSNGYQPNNVDGKKLSKTGDTITFETKTLSGQKQIVTQNIWRTSDGKQYYWDGRYNKYIQITTNTKKKNKTGQESK